MATARKLPSGNWRVRVYLGHDANGKSKRVSITAATEAEANYEALALTLKKKQLAPDMTVEEAIYRYIDSKSNILSPTTIHGYHNIVRNRLTTLRPMTLRELTKPLIQMAVNADAVKYSPKTIANAYGLMLSAIRMVAPDIDLSVTFPVKQSRRRVLPHPADIITAVKGTDIELPVLLAIWLSFTMSEIRGIHIEDIRGNVLTLARVVVDAFKPGIVKETFKEDTRARVHIVPPILMDLIRATGKSTGPLVDMTANMISKRYRAVLQRHKVEPMITFHDLRHLNATVMGALHVPEKIALERGGWKTDHVMKAVYQETFSGQRQEYDAIIDEYFESLYTG